MTVPFRVIGHVVDGPRGHDDSHKDEWDREGSPHFNLLRRPLTTQASQGNVQAQVAAEPVKSDHDEPMIAIFLGVDFSQHQRPPEP